MNAYRLILVILNAVMLGSTMIAAKEEKRKSAVDKAVFASIGAIFLLNIVYMCVG